MSDIHGCLDAFQSALSLVDLSGDCKLVLLGDYIHGGENSYGVLEMIMELERRYGDKIIVLAGNHEDMAMDGTWPISEDQFSSYSSYYNENCDEAKEDIFLRWMAGLSRYHVEDHIIFVHAGIEEDAEDAWEWCTDDTVFTEKYPAETGKFYEDLIIVAGHIGTAEIADDPYFHDIYFDGESHYYIDGTVLDSGVIPVLKIDTDSNKFYQVTENGDTPIFPYRDVYGE